MTGDYPILKLLRAGKTLEQAGFQFKMAEGKIEPGDLFVGETDTCSARLLTAKEVVMKQQAGKTVIDYVYPHSPALKFEGHQVVRVQPALTKIA